MKVNRRLKTKEPLQNRMNVRRLAQILTSDDVAYVLQMIVHDHRDMIGRRDILSGKDDVPEEMRIDFCAHPLLSVQRYQFLKVKRQARRVLQVPNRLFTVETKRECTLCRHFGLSLVLAETLAGAWIMRTVRPVRGRSGPLNFGGNLLARTKAGIGQTGVCEAFNGCLVVTKVLRLAAYRLFPFKAEPCQIFKDRVFKFAPATRNIDILDTQDESPAALASKVMGCEGRISMPGMKQPGRAWRKSGPGLRSA